MLIFQRNLNNHRVTEVNFPQKITIIISIKWRTERFCSFYCNHSFIVWVRSWSYWFWFYFFLNYWWLGLVSYIWGRGCWALCFWLVLFYVYFLLGCSWQAKYYWENLLFFKDTFVSCRFLFILLSFWIFSLNIQCTIALLLTYSLNFIHRLGFRLNFHLLYIQIICF